MKDKKRMLWIAVFCLCAAAMLTAQTVAPNRGIRIGLGVAIGKEVLAVNDQEESFIPSINQVDLPTFYIPILIIPTIRIEPEFGYLKASSSVGGIDRDVSLMLFGGGVFLTQWYGPVDLYFGGRFDLLKSSVHVNKPVDQTTTRTDLIYGPAVGGEYFFDSLKKLSIGGEIQFNFVKLGEIKGEEDRAANAGTGKIDRSIVRTKPLIFVRWYFGRKG